MKIATISDLHLTKNDQKSITLWKKFIHSPDVTSATHIYLLGDIFDLMIGGKKDYLEYYSFFFESLEFLIREGKKIVYLEGNHDFHLESVFSQFLKENKFNNDQLEYKKDEFRMLIGKKKYLFCHGDIIDHKNKSFKKWKRIYRSKLFQKFVNHLVPFEFIVYLGAKASNNSKKRNKKEFNYEKAFLKYREGAEYVFNSHDVDVIIAGHTHVKDVYGLRDGKKYLNNGFPQKHKSFILITKDEACLKLLV